MHTRITSAEGVPPSSSRRPDPLGRPRLRGWLHLYGVAVATICAAVLLPLAATRDGLAPLISCAVYAVGVCACFGTSALYHRRIWQPRGYAIMRRLDHAMIFLLIAGTYTPFCVLLLAPDTATTLLSVVWIGAALGAVIQVAWPAAPRWLTVPIYIALGWTAVAVLPEILHNGGVTPLALLISGGALYSIGAICYGLKRPNPWPATFGHHEVFHACTLAAAICHHIAVYFALFA